MTPVEQGRFCAHCQKEVIDFTGLNDEQVVQVLKSKSGQSLCGRYHPWQLNREIVTPKPTRNFWIVRFKRIAASLLLLQSGITAGWAHGRRHRIHQVPGWSSNRFDSNVIVKPINVVFGLVRDRITGKALNGIEIKVTGTDFKGVTGPDGLFEIFIADSFYHLPITLCARYAESAGAAPIGTIIPDVLVTKGWPYNLVNYLYQYPIDKLNDSTLPEMKPYVFVAGESKIEGTYLTDNNEDEPFLRKWLRRKKKSEKAAKSAQ